MPRHLDKILAFWLLLMCYCCHGWSQAHQFKVMLNKDVLLPGDTLDIIADYSIENRSLPPATFAVVVMATQGDGFWQIRWPMVDGKSGGTIIWPAGIPPGRYNLLFAVQPRFLKFFGKVIFPEKPGNLTAYFTGSTGSYPLFLSPDRLQRFEINNLMFNDSVYMSFAHENENEPAPALVQLDAWLDSSFQPAATSVKQVVVNAIDQPAIAPLPLKKEIVFAEGYGMFYSTSAIQKKRTKWPQLDGLALYDSLYLPPAFAYRPQWVFNCIEPDSIEGKNSVFELLLTKMPAATVDRWVNENSIPAKAPLEMRIVAGETMIKWQDKWYRIYWRGKYSDPSVLMLHPQALAAIRVFDPPFVRFPGVKQNFGTIAFFERRFPFPQPFPFYNGYWIRGYSSEIFALPL